MEKKAKTNKSIVTPKENDEKKPEKWEATK